jgi:hypothetical protein
LGQEGCHFPHSKLKHFRTESAKVYGLIGFTPQEWSS